MRGYNNSGHDHHRVARSEQRLKYRQLRQEARQGRKVSKKNERIGIKTSSDLDSISIFPQTPDLISQAFDKSEADNATFVMPAVNYRIGKVSNITLFFLFSALLPLIRAEVMKDNTQNLGDYPFNDNNSFSLAKLDGVKQVASPLPFTQYADLAIINSLSSVKSTTPIINQDQEISITPEYSSISYIASIAGIALPWLIYMGRSSRSKKIYDIIAKKIGSKNGYKSQIDEEERALDDNLPQTTEEQFDKLMMLIAYIIDESKLPDKSFFGSIKALITRNLGNYLDTAKLRRELYKVISPDNLAIILVAYQVSKPSLGNTKRDRETINKLDAILLKLACAFEEEEIYSKPQTHQNYTAIVKNIEQIGGLFKQFQEQPLGFKKVMIEVVSKLYPSGCVFASIPGFFSFATPSELTRPFYSLFISSALVAAYSANTQYVKGMINAFLRAADGTRELYNNPNYKTILPLLVYGTLAIAASSIGSATQDLAGNRICSSVGGFFGGNNIAEFCANRQLDTVFLYIGRFLATVSLGVAPMTYYDVRDLGGSIFNLNNWRVAPEKLIRFTKEHPLFAAAFPLFQIAAQLQVAAYSLTAFIKFRHYFGEAGANVAFIIAALARVALVSRSSLFAQRRFDSVIHEASSSCEKQIDDLIKISIVLEDQILEQENKKKLQQNLVKKFELDPKQDLVKQLEAKRIDPKFKELIDKKGGIEKILQEVQAETKVLEFKPLELYRDLARGGYSQILPWLGLFANGAAAASTVSNPLEIPQIFGGGYLPDVVRGFAVVATLLVSVFICSRYLGFKTREEHEKIKKYAYGIIGDQKAYEALVKETMIDINSRSQIEESNVDRWLEMATLISKRAQEESDVEAGLVDPAIIIEDGESKLIELKNRYSKLELGQQKLLEDNTEDQDRALSQLKERPNILPSSIKEPSKKILPIQFTAANSNATGTAASSIAIDVAVKGLGSPR